MTCAVVRVIAMLCSTTAEVGTSCVANFLAYGKKPERIMTEPTQAMETKQFVDTTGMKRLCWMKSFVDAVALYISLYSS